jgi:hypothetical protein
MICNKRDGTKFLNYVISPEMAQFHSPVKLCPSIPKRSRNEVNWDKCIICQSSFCGFLSFLNVFFSQRKHTFQFNSLLILESGTNDSRLYDQKGKLKKDHVDLNKVRVRLATLRDACLAKLALCDSNGCIESRHLYQAV